MVIVAVRRPSGDLFEVDVPKDATLNTLKAAIAAKTKEAVTRQKLLLGHEVLSDERLQAGLAEEDRLEVLHLVSRSCTLVTHQHSAAGVWDGDDQTLVRPVFQKDDLDFTHAVDAMYLEDGELYTLVRCGRLSDEIYFIQLWCGVPGRAVGRFSLPGRWLNESVRIEFSPEGEFVIASSMGTILMWRTLTGEEIQRADCAHWGGSIKSMVLRLAVLFQGDPEGSGIFNRKYHLNLWDYHAGLQKQSWVWPEPLDTPQALLSASGARVAIWSYQKELAVYDCQSGHSIKTWFDEALTVAVLNFSPSEEEIVVSYKQNLKEVKIIRIVDGQMRSALLPEWSSCRFLSSVGYSADGTTLALAEAGGVLHRWNGATLDILDLLPATPLPAGDIMESQICRDQNFFHSHQ
ncbi:Copia protein [Durusdinium trenchii]|uniref:Copia protein n=1 Tax=Durusdinium trenchii TaxID=1381693 RepID=A0ABP0QXY0_9DINO